MPHKHTRDANSRVQNGTTLSLDPDPFCKGQIWIRPKTYYMVPDPWGIDIKGSGTDPDQLSVPVTVSVPNPFHILDVLYDCLLSIVSDVRINFKEKNKKKI